MNPTSKLLTTKTHRIYRFDFLSRNTVKNYEKGMEFLKFKKELIDAFSGTFYAKLVSTYFLKNSPKYKKPWLHSAFDIGIDMVMEATDMKVAKQWDYEYFAVPLENTKLIEFFEENKPNFVKEKKKFVFPVR